MSLNKFVNIVKLPMVAAAFLAAGFVGGMNVSTPSAPQPEITAVEKDVLVESLQKFQDQREAGKDTFWRGYFNDQVSQKTAQDYVAQNEAGRTLMSKIYYAEVSP